MRSYKARLDRLKNLPQNQIPSFRVEFADGSTQMLYGYQLVIPRDVRRVHYDPAQPCAQVVLDLFRKLRGDGAEVIANAQR